MTQENEGQLPEEEELGEKAIEPVKEKKGPHRSCYIPNKSAAASLLFAGVVSAILAGFELAWGGGPVLARLLWPAFVGLVAFLILWTGRVARFRSLFFVVLAWAFVLHFKYESLGLGGSAFGSGTSAVGRELPEVVTAQFPPTENSPPRGGRIPAALPRGEGGGSVGGGPEQLPEVPYCHIAIASSFLNYVYFQFLAFKSGSWRMWGPLTLGVLWLAVTLVLGQAWCSWACFYGGLDDGFSRLFSKPKLRWWSLPGRLREFPAALLVFMMLVSLSTLLPVFCLWVCPLKLTTSFLDPNETTRRIQLALFALSGTLGLILLPIMTKKRAFCGLICPFGPWQAFWGRASPFRVTIDAEACTQCQLCLKACPVFAIEGEGLKSHVIGPYCNRCGECLDVCAPGAIRYTILGLSLGPRGAGGIFSELWDARVIFLFSALLVGGSVGSLFVPGLLARFWP